MAELKKDGTDYEPESLCTMLAALVRHFHSNGCKHSTVKDKEFVESKRLLNFERKAKESIYTNKADALNKEEEVLLWQMGVLEDANPVSVNYAVFYIVNQHLEPEGSSDITKDEYRSSNS